MTPHLLRGFPGPAKHCRMARLQKHAVAAFRGRHSPGGPPHRAPSFQTSPPKLNTPVLSTPMTLRDG
jgi:hypothetical protein